MNKWGHCCFSAIACAISTVLQQETWFFPPLNMETMAGDMAEMHIPLYINDDKSVFLMCSIDYINWRKFLYTESKL